MNKKLASIAIAAVALGGTATLLPSIASAQDEAPAEEQTSDERPDFLGEALQPFVDDGTLTQSEADEIADAIREARPEHGPRHLRFHSLETLTEVLGIDADTLRDELASGKSIAEIAEENGVDVQDVIDALVAAANERIDEAVADGHLDEDEADAKRADLEESITARVNGEIPEDGFGRGGFGPGGPRGDSDLDD